MYLQPQTHKFFVSPKSCLRERLIAESTRALEDDSNGEQRWNWLTFKNRGDRTSGLNISTVKPDNTGLRYICEVSSYSETIKSLLTGVYRRRAFYAPQKRPNEDILARTNADNVNPSRPVCLNGDLSLIHGLLAFSIDIDHLQKYLTNWKFGNDFIRAPGDPDGRKHIPWTIFSSDA
jgi:hypothetical protein